MSWTRLSSVTVLASCSLVAAGCSLESTDGTTVQLESAAQLHDPSEADSLDSYEVVPAPCLIPKTGQTVSYGTRDDGELQQGIAWPSERFTGDTDTVTDALTGLMWPRYANPLMTARTWAQALEGVQLLNQSNDGAGYLGYTDWRLPNVNELESLIDYGKVNPALPDTTTFTGVVGVGGGTEDLAKSYWSSTPVQPTSSGATAALGKSFYSGTTVMLDQLGSLYVWPVRTAGEGVVALPQTGWLESTSVAPGDDGAQSAGTAWPEERFRDIGDGTVADLLTGLMWTQGANEAGATTWHGALSWLDQVNTDTTGKYGGYTDWRLPNARELRSLLDYSQKQPPLLPVNPFTNVQPALYWTSTTFLGNTAEAGTVSLEVASDLRFAQPKGTTLYVWPVRGNGTVLVTPYTEAEEPTEPTDPEPTDPEPTDPEPTDPEPTDPELAGRPDDLQVSASPDTLWAPNHKMVAVSIGIDPAPVSARIVEVTSNEPINGVGDGNTDPDYVITGDLTLELRAERSGKGSGRVYTITIDCTWPNGDVTSEDVQVTVAHDQR